RFQRFTYFKPPVRLEVIDYFAHLFFNEEFENILLKINALLKENGTAILSLVSIKDRHFSKGHKIDFRLYEVFKGIPWRFYDLVELKNICNKNGINIIDIYEFTEFEIVNNKPDLVNSIYLSFTKS
ncbi:MAG: hypothetical protein K8S23_02540, partial [Candidatus Cloacimonetes bacterium]|nr:hypothetical protein [Candidatus Cloacimonadota bacterium]